MALTGLVSVKVTVAVSYWHLMHQYRVREFNKTDKMAVGLDSGAGRKKLFYDLVHERVLNFTLWSLKEVSFFMQVAFQRELLCKFTVEETQPRFLLHVFHTWKPYLNDFLTFLWDYWVHECAFYGDFVYLLPLNQLWGPKDIFRHLFLWLPRRKCFTEWTFSSTAYTLVPYEKSPRRTHVHDEYTTMPSAYYRHLTLDWSFAV